MSGSTHHQRENVDGEPPGGVGAEGLGTPTINKKTLTAGPGRCQSWRSRSAVPVEPALGQGGELLQKPRDKCSKSS
jgi:hypothetical protein